MDISAFVNALWYQSNRIPFFIFLELSETCCMNDIFIYCLLCMEDKLIIATYPNSEELLNRV